MNKKLIRILAVLISALMLSTLAIGCSSTDSNNKASTSTAASTAALAPQSSAAETATAQKEDITVISFYGAPNQVIGSIVGNDPDSSPLNQAILKRFKDKYGFGIKHQYIFCGADEAIQKQQLMLAADEPWDTMGIETAYPGGLTAAGRDGVIVDWMQYKDHIPNILKLFDQQPMLSKQLKTDTGALYSVGDVRINSMSSIFFGPFIRKDLLDKAGITSLPETIQEWHDDLIALKNAGLPHLFSYEIGWFAGYSNGMVSAWDGAGFPQVDGGMAMVINDAGQAVYGAGSEGFGQWLAEMNKWYTEGILDIDGFTNYDWGVSDTKIVNNQIAGGLHFLGDVGSCDTAGKKADPNFTLTGTKYPVLNKGDKPRMGQWDPMGITGGEINAKSKYITELLDLTDMQYDAEGIMLHNYGIEGKTYTLVDGKPKFTDYWLFSGEKNVDGLTFGQVQNLYSGNGNTVYDPDVWFLGNTKTQAEKDSIPLWDDVQRPANELRFISFTPIEQELVKKKVDLDTYASQQMMQFIIGKRPMSEYPAYMNELKTKFAMDDIVKVYNTAFQRYKNR